MRFFCPSCKVNQEAIFYLPTEKTWTIFVYDNWFFIFLHSFLHPKHSCLSLSLVLLCLHPAWNCCFWSMKRRGWDQGASETIEFLCWSGNSGTSSNTQWYIQYYIDRTQGPIFTNEKHRPLKYVLLHLVSFLTASSLFLPQYLNMHRASSQTLTLHARIPSTN